MESTLGEAQEWNIKRPPYRSLNRIKTESRLFYYGESRVSITRHETHSRIFHYSGSDGGAVIEMIEDNNRSTIMPCFPKSDTEPTRSRDK
jgi:hypothetical protein